MTPNMTTFIEKNTTSKIVAGGHVTESGEPITSPFESIGVKYQFDDGSTLTMLKEDAQSAPEFTPVWKLD
tara:strand:+ start:320 stop:529 length:210 start_codon:yes stop_codon:yes gene_type:complete